MYLTPTAISILAQAAEDNKTLLWQHRMLKQKGLIDSAGKITEKGRAHLAQLSITPLPTLRATLWTREDGWVIRDAEGNAFSDSTLTEQQK